MEWLGGLSVPWGQSGGPSTAFTVRARKVANTRGIPVRLSLVQVSPVASVTALVASSAVNTALSPMSCCRRWSFSASSGDGRSQPKRWGLDEDDDDSADASACPPLATLAVSSSSSRSFSSSRSSVLPPPPPGLACCLLLE